MYKNEKLIIDNIDYVTSIAKKYVNRGLELEDLIEEGCIGLLVANEKFNINPTDNFKDFAFPYINHCILKAIENTSKLIKLSLFDMSDLDIINSIIDKFVIKFKRVPTMSEISNITGFTSEEIEKLLNISLPILNIDEENEIFKLKKYKKIKENYLNCEEDLTLSDLLIDINENTYFDEEEIDISELLLKSNLKPKQIHILRLAYGFYGDFLSINEIASLYGVTYSTIQRIIKESLVKIRQTLGLNDNQKVYKK